MYRIKYTKNDSWPKQIQELRKEGFKSSSYERKIGKSVWGMLNLR